MRQALVISAGLMLIAILLVGIAVGEEDTLDRGLFPPKGYGLIYNHSCRDGSPVGPGCFGRTGWQKCRYPGNIPGEQDLQFPICPSNQQGVPGDLSQTTTSSLLGKREKRNARRRRVQTRVRNVGINIRIDFFFRLHLGRPRKG